MLDTLVDAFQDGGSAEEIALRYPSLSLSDIYAAIAYYLGNQAAVDSYVSERRLAADAVRRENAERFDLSGLRERLLARRLRVSTGGDASVPR